LISANKINQAIERAKRFEPEQGSYSKVYRAFEVFNINMHKKEIM